MSILERFQAEINLLKIRAQRHHNNYMNIDEEMNSFLESRYSSENLSSLLDLWKNETSGEELKSVKRWKSKQKWLKQYEKELKQSDFVKTPFPKEHPTQQERSTAESAHFVHHSHGFNEGTTRQRHQRRPRNNQQRNTSNRRYFTNPTPTRPSRSTSQRNTLNENSPRRYASTLQEMYARRPRHQNRAALREHGTNTNYSETNRGKNHFFSSNYRSESHTTTRQVSHTTSKLPSNKKELRKK